MGVERDRQRGRRVPGHAVAPVTRELGALIREERRRLKMGQEELAAAAGISQAALSYLERGICLPKMETIERIALALGWWCEDFIAEARRRGELRVAKI